MFSKYHRKLLHFSLSRSARRSLTSPADVFRAPRIAAHYENQLRFVISGCMIVDGVEGAIMFASVCVCEWVQAPTYTWRSVFMNGWAVWIGVDTVGEFAIMC